MKRYLLPLYLQNRQGELEATQLEIELDDDLVTIFFNDRSVLRNGWFTVNGIKDFYIEVPKFFVPKVTGKFFFLRPDPPIPWGH